jgi:hypothetical protein
LTSTRKTPPRQAPTWLNATVYEPKRQRTFEVVKRAVDTLAEQRKQDGVTRISLNSIVAMAKQQDPASQGIAHTSILENAEAYAYYKKFRTTSLPKQRQSASQNGSTHPVIKIDRDQSRVRQRYMKWNRTDLVNQLLSVEQQYAELQERYLATCDQLLEWQLRAETAEARVKQEREQQAREAKPPLPVKTSSSKTRQRKSAESTTGPLPKHFVSLLAFADDHHVVQTKVRTHVDVELLPAKRGEWTDTSGTVVTMALDAKGRAAFYQLYHELPLFIVCSQCPHQETPVDQTKLR